MWSRSVMAFQLFRFRNRRTKSVSHWMRCNDNQMRMRSKYFIIKRAAIVSHTVFCSPLFKYELWRMMEWPSSLSFIRTRMKKNHRVWNTFIANWLWWVQCDEWKSAVDVDTDDNNLNMLNAHSKSFEIKKMRLLPFLTPKWFSYSFNHDTNPPETACKLISFLYKKNVFHWGYWPRT